MKQGCAERAFRLCFRKTAWGACKILNADGSEDTSVGSLGWANPIRYRGYYYDNNLGLYYLTTRYYDPETGRFTSADDSSYLAPDTINGLNLYAYCGNNPVMNVDPEGHAWWEWLVAAAVVVVCAVAAVATAGTSLVAGAALAGAAVGGGVSVASQAVDVAVNGGDFSWGQFALDIGIGAASGMVGVSAISKIGSTLVGAGMNGISNISSQLISGKTFSDISWIDVGVSTALGGFAGLLAGAGAKHVDSFGNSYGVQKAAQGLNTVKTRIASGTYYTTQRGMKSAMTQAQNRMTHAVIKQIGKNLSKALCLGALGTGLSNAWCIIT